MFQAIFSYFVERGCKRSYGETFQREASAVAPVAKGSGVSCQPALPGPRRIWAGGASSGPASVTRRRCGLDWGGPGGHRPCPSFNRVKKNATFPSMLREPSRTSDRCHGATPGCRFPPPVTDHSRRLPPGFNKTWGKPEEGRRERGLESLSEIATVVWNIDLHQIL